MTATQLFFLFLKDECSITEMRFFKRIVMKDPGNKYFSKRPLFKPTFVEDYLARNNRAINNSMTRLFILAPNLSNCRRENPRLKILRDSYNERNRGKIILVKRIDWYENVYTVKQQCYFKDYPGMYINYYKRKWNEFLKNKIDSEKKFNSPFRRGESYDFKLKNKNDTN